MHSCHLWAAINVCKYNQLRCYWSASDTGKKLINNNNIIYIIYICQTLSSFSLCFHTHIWSFLFPVISPFIPICVWFVPHLMLFPLIMLCVHKPWVFPESSLSLCPSTRLWGCVSCVPSLKSLIPFTSRLLPATRLWQYIYLYDHCILKK